MTPTPPPTDGPMHFTMDGEKLMSDGKCVAWLGFGPGRVSMKLTNEEMEKFRAFIVRAVNSHQDGVDFATDFLAYVDDPNMEIGELKNRAMAYIAIAQGGK